MRLIDSVMVYNEIDLLKVRMSEHYPHVDRIYVVEATKTHSNLDKPLYFDERKDEFSEWSDKIEHMVIDGEKHFVPATTLEKGIQNERVQRKAVQYFREDEFNSCDYLVCTDLDEIIYDWPALFNTLDKNPRHVNICMDFFYYFIDAKFPVYWMAEDRIKAGPKRLRHKSHVRAFKAPIGWHFSSLGGPEVLSGKLASTYDHGRLKELRNPDNLRISMKELRTFFRSERTCSSEDKLTVQTDLSYLPQYMKDHMDIWEGYMYRSFK